MHIGFTEYYCLVHGHTTHKIEEVSRPGHITTIRKHCLKCIEEKQAPDDY